MNESVSDSPNWGARYIGDGQTRFRLWAPDLTELQLAIYQQDPQPMTPSGDGWFELTTHAEPGTRYGFKQPERILPDPASRLQQGGPHGWSVVTDAQAWTNPHPAWLGRPWAETVIYELHVGTSGGFNGVRHRLAELAALGITAIELMPIAATPGNRNWGYDGVLPFAVHEALGTPDELHQLIDTAHGLGIQVFLDVVYNHFGPDGNFLHAYASTFFVDGPHTPWGQAIDFRQAQVGQFWLENALYWLNDFHFDGLRFDAVHAIADDAWLADLARNIRAGVAPDRHVHLMLENEQNSAELLRQGSHDIANDPRYDAQWNDDAHNALHVLLTGEDEGYYSAFAHTPDGRTPIQHLVRCMGEGFAWQGEPWPLREGEHRGARSGLLPPTAFIFFLQNHDQIGNRAMGERLTVLTSPQKLRAARVLQLLCPQIPLLFMGEEWGSKQPFLFFTDHHGELAEAVRNGRRREFAHFAAFKDEQKRAQIPDPNEPQTFTDSEPGMPPLDDEEATAWLDLTRELLAIRQHAIAPALDGARATQAAALSDKALVAQWKLADQRTLTLFANFDDAPLALTQAPDWASRATGQLDINRMLYETPTGASNSASTGELPGNSCVAWIEDVPTAQVSRAHESAELPLELPTMVPVVGG
ncbi:malto-oligosyltrehalose trehalohydrolase [Amantichitinum ursilacus]|uniref:Malto-oligosyltrehalose trehalohydrolase n=1 Tax=Amantichitinum ursilacus TaxID=857265 RepID=A0A0N0GPT3_9NEIS|nr:malto-oligosyltrehalose trehalohydrolase [Amantichitinum ursilacus]KPC53802.1 Malto-oligosyltrehalose trehalohydrolase [Amantichitinum ursilacus]